MILYSKNDDIRASPEDGTVSPSVLAPCPGSDSSCLGEEKEAQGCSRKGLGYKFRTPSGSWV